MNLNIPEPYMILDLRPPNEFKGVTISGFKKQDVVTIFQNSMINSKLEDSLKWMVELHSSGLNNNIWDSLFQVYFKYIHLQNPHLYLYLMKRFKEYNKMVSILPTKKHEIFTKNDMEIRHLFTELVAIQTLTKKNNLFLPKSLPKIDKTFYSKETIQRHMISNNLDQIYNFVHVQQDNDIKLALNEILTNLESEHGTFSNCIYWYLWLEKVENLKKKDKLSPVVFDKKDVKPVHNVDEEFWALWIWSLWDIILHIVQEKSEKKKYYVEKMYEDYRYEFKPFQINKKKLLFFMAFYVLKNQIDWNIPLYTHESFIIQSCGNINTLYREIKNHIEQDLSLDDRNTLYEEYLSLHNNLMEMKQNKEEMFRPSKEPEKIKNTCISQIDPTHHPHIKPLSRGTFREEIPNIEYHHMIEEQARILEKDFEKEIYKGTRARQRDTSNVKSMVERIRKNINEDDDENNDDEQKNKKLELYTQFISYKSNNQSKSLQSPNNKEDGHKYKTIEFQERRRSSHKKHHYEKMNEEEDEYDNFSE